MGQDLLHWVVQAGTLVMIFPGQLHSSVPLELVAENELFQAIVALKRRRVRDSKVLEGLFPHISQHGLLRVGFCRKPKQIPEKFLCL